MPQGSKTFQHASNVAPLAAQASVLRRAVGLPISLSIGCQHEKGAPHSHCSCVHDDAIVLHASTLTVRHQSSAEAFH